MLTRKDKILFEILTEMKLIWALIPIETLLVYFVIKSLASTSLSKISVLKPILNFLQTNAGNITVFLFFLFTTSAFFLAIVIAFKRLYRRWLLETNTDLDKIRSMPWYDFELLVGQIFRHQGYDVEEKGGPGPDGGVDIILRKGKNKIIVQCKHWKNWTVGVSPVRELLGSMTAEKGTSCIFVTCGDYTPGAVTFAEDKPIQLIDGVALLDLIHEVNGSNEKLIPEKDESKPVIPHCPLCNSLMVQRDARRGATAGMTFWGCTNYPECRGTRPYKPEQSVRRIK